VLDFHGYLLMPLTLGFNERDNPQPGQGKTVVHNPPLVPLNSRDFSHTGVVPTPYGQLNFIYGNSLLSATLILAAENFTDATGLYNPVEQLGARLAVAVHPQRQLRQVVRADGDAVDAQLRVLGNVLLELLILGELLSVRGLFLREVVPQLLEHELVVDEPENGADDDEDHHLRLRWHLGKIGHARH